jgi:tRNA A-37 threonylcarbamoyl transferase component Bud32
MSPRDATGPASDTYGDDPTAACPSPASPDDTRHGDTDPAGETLAAPAPTQEDAPTQRSPDASTIDRIPAESTDSTTTPLAAGPSPVAATQTVPGYDLLEPLGEGGMGVVWKARQTKLNRLVALKMVLGDQRAGSKDLIRFLAEAEAVAAIKHPHVVQVYEYGDAGGRPYLAMEYLPGGSLSNRLEQTGRLDPTSAAELVGTLAGAVQAAHDLGIVHRDLKPGNVLFDDRGQPKVTDFGLAKRTGGSNLTATQAVMGTPAYMAPEQARGDTKFVGPQADVYSLGVILYECLTGVKPFRAPDQYELLRKVMEEEPERPGKRRPGLPRDVELICLKCLAKDPTERYPTAGALAADLGRFAAGEPVSVRAAGVVERAAKWARRKPTLAAAYTLGLLAMLLGGLGGAAAWQWRAAEWARDAAESARGEAIAARDGERRAREQLAAVEYGRAMQVAHQEWREANVAATLALLDSTRADLRGWEWRYVHRLCHSSLLTLKGHTRAVFSASFSPDGSRVATGSEDGTARLWDARTGAELLALKGHTDGVTSASFSPDGSRVVTASTDQTARVWDARSGAEVLALRGHTYFVVSASFSPDGSRVVTGSEDGTARVWDSTPINREFLTRDHNSPPQAVK